MPPPGFYHLSFFFLFSHSSIIGSVSSSSLMPPNVSEKVRLELIWSSRIPGPEQNLWRICSASMQMFGSWVVLGGTVSLKSSDIGAKYRTRSSAEAAPVFGVLLSVCLCGGETLPAAFRKLQQE